MDLEAACSLVDPPYDELLDLDAALTRLAALDPAVAGRFKKVLNELGLAHFQRAIGAENAAQRGLQA